MFDNHEICTTNSVLTFIQHLNIFFSNNCITITIIIITIILFYECFVFMHGKGVSMLEATKYATGLPRHCHLAV